MTEVITEVRVLVADDHPIFRKGLIEVITASEGFSVVAEAVDGTQALELAGELMPDIAVLDIAMPGKDGLEVTAECQEFDGQVRCVILTMYDDEEYLRRALDLGARGYLLKENAVSELITCLQQVADDQVYLSPAVSWHLAPNSVQTREPSPIEQLTDAERRVLRLIGQGKTSKEAAKELEISYRTVQNHRNNAALKLGIKGANQLLKFAVENKTKL